MSQFEDQQAGSGVRVLSLERIKADRLARQQGPDIVVGTSAPKLQPEDLSSLAQPIPLRIHQPGVKPVTREALERMRQPSLEESQFSESSSRAITPRRRIDQDQWLEVVMCALEHGADKFDSSRLYLTLEAKDAIEKSFPDVTARPLESQRVGGNPDSQYYITIPVSSTEVERLVRLANKLKDRPDLKVFDGSSAEFEDHHEVSRWIRRHDATIDGEFIQLPMELIRVLKQRRTGEDAGLPLVREENRDGKTIQREIRLYQLSPEDILKWSRMSEEDRPKFKYRFNPEDKAFLEDAAKTPKTISDIVIGRSRSLVSNHYVRLGVTVSTFLGGMYAFLTSDTADKVKDFFNSKKEPAAVVQSVDEHTTHSLSLRADVENTDH